VRAPRNLYRPLVAPTDGTLQDLFVRFGHALSPQLYRSETASTRRISASKQLWPMDIQKSITSHHHSQLGGVFVLELLSFLGTAAVNPGPSRGSSCLSAPILGRLVAKAGPGRQVSGLSRARQEAQRKEQSYDPHR
jgi:hypothetical protein